MIFLAILWFQTPKNWELVCINQRFPIFVIEPQRCCFKRPWTFFLESYGKKWISPWKGHRDSREGHQRGKSVKTHSKKDKIKTNGYSLRTAMFPTMLAAWLTSALTCKKWNMDPNWLTVCEKSLEVTSLILLISRDSSEVALNELSQKMRSVVFLTRFAN